MENIENKFNNFLSKILSERETPLIIAKDEKELIEFNRKLFF